MSNGFFDRASEYEAKWRAMAIAKELHRAEHPTGPSLHFCEECEEPIPEARRIKQFGCRLCVDCQKEKDEREKACRRR